MSFLDTLNQMLVILFAIGVGYLAHHLGYLGGEVNEKLSHLILNVTIPAMILAAVLQAETLPGVDQILTTLLASAMFYVVEFIGVFLVPRLLGGTAKEKGVWRFALTFPNIGFIGYPVVEALFGAEGLFFAVVLALPFNLLNYTLGPLMLSGTFRLSWKQFLSPAILVSAASLVITLTGTRLPPIIGSMADLVGDVSIPLSLLVLGSMLASMPIGRVFGSIRLWVLSAIRLLAMPAALCVVLHLLGTDPLIAGVAVAQMAMPVSVNGSMMCLEFNGDGEAMARSIFLSTILSILTIPLAAVWFMQF